MDEKLFAKLVPQLQPLTYLLCLHIMGEPLCHPHLEHFLDICSEHNMKVSIVTNGTLLNKHHECLLMHPAVRQINFSLQSFESNFPNMDNEHYLNTIFQFISRSFIKRPDLHINFRLWNSKNIKLSLVQNRSILDRIQNYFKIPDEVMDNLSKHGNRLTGDLYINFADRFEWPEIEMPFQSKKGSCPALKNQFGILYDGTLVPCCLDKDGVINLGNCHEQSIQEILDSKRTTLMINGFKQRKLVEPLCQHCTFNTV